LLIDSLINGYDVPKIYFHEFDKQKRVKGKLVRYAIVDGKQRLQAIWDFMDGAFPLSDAFEYLRDDNDGVTVEAAGIKYEDLGKKYPRIKARFDSTRLDVIAIRTDDLEQIEEMFSRLNEAVPLNAAEQRNAWQGPLPGVIRKFATHKFFTKRLPFSNKRYRHYDIAAKFLYFEHADKIVDTKKVYLDAFVEDYKGKTAASANTLEKSASAILDKLAAIFSDSDPLLRSVGMVTLYYLMIRQGSLPKGFNRNALHQFENARIENRKMAEADIKKGDYDLLEFDRYVQSPNDAYANELRLRVLTEWLAKPRRKTANKLGPKIKKSQK